MENKALEIVLKFLNNSGYTDISKEDLYVTWKCYILGDEKYLIGLDGTSLYFEVTYCKRVNDWNLDVYKQIYTERIDNN